MNFWPIFARFQLVPPHFIDQFIPNQSERKKEKKKKRKKEKKKKRNKNKQIQSFFRVSFESPFFQQENEIL